MAHSCSCESNGAPKTPTDASDIANLPADIYRACSDGLRNDIGTMACEVFRRVDLEGQRLEVAADAVGLDSQEALVMLVIVRRRIADALTGDIPLGKPIDSRI